jgi:hypothetical protein
MSVKPTGQQQLSGERVSGHLLQISSTGRHQRPALEDYSIDATTVIENYVAKLMCRGEALNVQATARCDDDAP